MGQTLTHGIYLPDEGERNCYNGLAGNWQLLDGAVGTIAEHTTALAGKAPAVHTHTKSDITDFPAYGTTAGTICEGNDSRLSDARTPVAHTHTKSDVTDLLNSNFIPSANNSYDLGSSSYQWNNVYASKIRQFDSFSGYADVYQVLDSSNNRIVSFRITKGATKNTLGINVHGQNNSAPKGLVIENDLSNNITITGGGTNNYLGTSTSKWKSLNGLNPGALSLPKTESGRYSLTELSSIPGIGVDNWVLDGGKIVLDAEYVITGWLYVCIACDTDGYVILQTGGYSYPNCFYKVTGTPIAGYASATIPIVEGIALALYLKGTSLLHARYYPAAGNV